MARWLWRGAGLPGGMSIATEKILAQLYAYHHPHFQSRTGASSVV